MFVGEFDVQLELMGPVVSHSSSMGGFGIDAVMARTRDSAGVERFYLPGTLIKGLVGEAWQELGQERWRNLYLGIASHQGDEPARGNVFFGDFINSDKSTSGLDSQFRIQIDPTTGSVRYGMVQVVESPWRAGEKATFAGKVRLLTAEAGQAQEVHLAVARGLNWITAAGASRSSGFGRVAGVDCKKLKQTKPTPAVSPADELLIEIRPSEPFCLALRRIADNLFASSEIIPGGAIKGAIAGMLGHGGGAYSELAADLHAIHFSHAFPAKIGSARPEVVPLSMVRVPGEGAIMYNALNAWDEVKYREPAFDIDWKEDEAATVRSAFGWASPGAELRVRTQIDGARRKAKDENLFAYRMIVPHGYHWRGRTSLAGVPEERRAAVSRQLQEVLSLGLFGLGKSKTWAGVTCQAGSAPAPRQRSDSRMVITLQTPALLCDPSRVLAPNGTTGTALTECMNAEYQAVWRELCGGCLELVDYFHRNSLAGGPYFRHRFQGGKQYRPYLLTETGSVFVFQVRDAAGAAKSAERWLKLGLPIPASARRFYYLDEVAEAEWWRRCPFLPENGYGEIAINGAVHECKSKNLRTGEASHV